MAYSFRHDPSVPSFPDDRPIIVFDGDCVFCSASVRFILWADKRRRFRLMTARGVLGAALYRHFGRDPESYETNILLADGQAWLESAASIRIFEILGFPWSLMRIFWLVPGSLRDRLYRLIARNRLRWFGVRDTCFLPDPSQMDRFLG